MQNNTIATFLNLLYDLKNVMSSHKCILFGKMTQIGCHIKFSKNDIDAAR